MTTGVQYLPGFVLLTMFVTSIPASRTPALNPNDDFAMLIIAAAFSLLGGLTSLVLVWRRQRLPSLGVVFLVWVVVSWCVSWFETYRLEELFLVYATPSLRTFLVLWAVTPVVLLLAALFAIAESILNRLRNA